MKKRTDNISYRSWVLLLLFLFVPALGMGQSQPLVELIQKAREAGIEQNRIDELQNRASNRGITDEQLMILLEPAVSLAEQNLPSVLIFQKAMEGIAKGIPAQQMVPVLQNIQHGMESMVPVIDNWIQRDEVGQMLEHSDEHFNRETFREEMVKVGVKASSQQAGPELVQDILNTLTDEGVISTSRPSSVLAAISIIPDIPSMGERPEEAKGVLIRAVRGGFTASEMQRLPGAMNMAQRRSQLPAAAVIEGVSQQMQGGIPAAEILQNLFNGRVGGGPPGNIPPGLENRRGRGRGQGQGKGKGTNNGN